MSDGDIRQAGVRRQADLLVQGGTVLTPNGAEHIDVACADGRIVALGDLQGTWSADTTLDATGLHVLPGVIDSQVHFREPGLTHKEDLESGTRGAVLGGVTSIFEMPNTHPLTLWAEDLQTKLDAAQGRAWCDYAFYIGGSAVNAEQLQTLEYLPGCAGVKVFMGSSFGDLLADDDTVLRAILRHGRRRMAVHAEDEARLRERKALVEVSGDVRQHHLWRFPHRASGGAGGRRRWLRPAPCARAGELRLRHARPCGGGRGAGWRAARCRHRRVGHQMNCP